MMLAPQHVVVHVVKVKVKHLSVPEDSVEALMLHQDSLLQLDAMMDMED
jgi:hypothetical protein